jgi:hypothetical protein
MNTFDKILAASRTKRGLLQKDLTAVILKNIATL